MSLIHLLIPTAAYLVYKSVYGKEEDDVPSHDYDLQQRRLKISKPIKSNRTKKEVDNSPTSSSEPIAIDLQVPTRFPIYAIHDQIQQQVKTNQVIIVKGQTGSGKSTQIPKYLAELNIGKVICAQPTKLAATCIANYLTREFAPMGSSIDCIVNHESLHQKLHNDSIIAFVTDCILLDILVDDPTLSSYGCVIVDQVHQRSLYTDILLAFLKQVLTLRSDLKLIMISENVDTKLFSDYFYDCPVVRLLEKQIPVDIKWCNHHVDHYFDKALDVIVDILNNSENGDILVFLVTPDETQKACIDINKRFSNNLDGIIALPMHEDLHATDLQRILHTDSHGRRKIIFTTSCIETSVTISGIRYVIDTGLIKERIYDDKSSCHVLLTRSISRDSAIQRCNHAGRTQSGVCYRLYSQQVYDNMLQSVKPEINRVHLLSNVILKMIALGATDIMNFDYIESPLLQSINNSLDTLCHLSAITTRTSPLGLTFKGGLYCQLLLEPRLSALIMNAKECNMLPEGIIIASVLSISYNLHCYYSSEEIKRDLDFDGDVISTVDIYIKWRSLYEKGQHDNCSHEYKINHKSMKHLHDKVCELHQSLFYLGIIKRKKLNIPSQLKSQSRHKLRQLICQCYHDRLALFTGVDKTGYIIANSDKQYLIHASSTLFSLQMKPKVIVYQDIITTSDHFLVNITSVDEEWLQSIDVSNNYAKMTNTLNNLVITQTIDNLGSSILSECNTNNIDEMIRKSLQDRSIRYSIAKNTADGKLQITGKNSTMPMLLNVINQFIMHKKEKLTKAIKILSKEDDNNAPRLVIGRGIIVKDILLSSDYIEFKITLHYIDHDNPDKDIVADIINEARALIMSCGELVVDIDNTDIIQSKDYKSIQFDKIVYQELHSQSLLKALDKQTISGYRIDIENGSLANCSISRDQIVVRFRWPRWPRIGTASITCSDDVTAIEVLDDLPLIIHNHPVYAIIDIGSPNKLFIENLPSLITAADIREAIPDGKRQAITDIHIHRVATNGDEDIYSADPEFALRNMLDINGYHGMYSDVIIKPMPSVKDDQNIIADVIFDTYDDAVCATHIFDGGIYNEVINEPISVRLSHSRIIRCQQQIYTYVNQEINRIRDSAKSINRDEEKYVDIDIEGSEKHSLAWITIVITSWNELRLNEVVHRISQIIEPVKVPIQETEILQFLDSDDGKAIFKSLTDPFAVYTKIDWNSQCLLIYADQKVKEQALHHCQEKINELLSKYNIINLVGNNKSRNLVKAMIKRYGVNMNRLLQSSGADAIRLNRHNNTLIVIGSEESFAKVSSEIDICCTTLQSTEKSSDEISANECVACFCEVDPDNYRLQYCGHLYCQQCMAQQVNSAIQSFNFPLNCANCNEGLVIADLEQLLMKSPQPRLFNVLITEFVRRHPDMWHYCPTPECELVYKRSESDEVFTCPKCQRKTCRGCDTDNHPGYDCDRIKLIRDQSHSIQKFKDENPNRVKDCPTCNATIEKNKGCNHMECINCKTHFCWHCLAGYETSNECYKHLRENHGGYV